METEHSPRHSEELEALRFQIFRDNILKAAIHEAEGTHHIARWLERLAMLLVLFGALVLLQLSLIIKALQVR